MIHFAHHEKYNNDAEFQAIYVEFQNYKNDSKPNEHESPRRNVQEKYESINEIFGRDRFDKDNEEARKENIQHLHIFQEGCEWYDDEGFALAQWYCTSDAALVYSYFCHNDQHHYFVIELYLTQAHENYESYVAYFVEQAKKYRLSVITPPNLSTE